MPKLDHKELMKKIIDGYTDEVIKSVEDGSDISESNYSAVYLSITMGNFPLAIYFREKLIIENNEANLSVLARLNIFCDSKERDADFKASKDGVLDKDPGAEAKDEDYVRERAESKSEAKSRRKRRVRCAAEGCNFRNEMYLYNCRCESKYCMRHLHADEHGCTFDYKAAGREQLEKSNPAVVRAKIDSL